MEMVFLCVHVRVCVCGSEHGRAGCGSSCLRRLQGRGWWLWPWKQRSLHKSIDPTGDLSLSSHFWPSERWCHERLNYLKPSSLLRCPLWELILTERARVTGAAMSTDWDVCGRGRRQQRESVSHSSGTSFPSLPCSQALQGPGWLHKKSWILLCWLLALNCSEHTSVKTVAALPLTFCKIWHILFYLFV